MKIKTGLLSLMIVCGACSRTTQPADVLKDNFDFASGQLNFAFSEIDQVKSAFTEEQKEKMLVSPRNIEPVKRPMAVPMIWALKYFVVLVTDTV